MYNQKGNLQRISVILFENKNNFSHNNRQPTIARLLTIASILVLSAAVLSTTLIGNSFAQRRIIIIIQALLQQRLHQAATVEIA